MLTEEEETVEESDECEFYYDWILKINVKFSNKWIIFQKNLTKINK